MLNQTKINMLPKKLWNSLAVLSVQTEDMFILETFKVLSKAQITSINYGSMKIVSS